MRFHCVTLVLPAVALARRLAESGSGAPAGDPSCPCLTAAQRSAVPGWSDALFVNDDGTTKVSLSGIDYDYPAAYGLGECAPHDVALLPYRAVDDPPDWCESMWCAASPTSPNPCRV